MEFLRPPSRFAFPFHTNQSKSTASCSSWFQENVLINLRVPSEPICTLPACIDAICGSREQYSESSESGRASPSSPQSEEDWKVVGGPTRSSNFSTESANAGLEVEDNDHSDSDSVDSYEACSRPSSSLTEVKEARPPSIGSGPTGESSPEKIQTADVAWSNGLRLQENNGLFTWTKPFHPAAWVSPAARGDVGDAFSKDAVDSVAADFLTPCDDHSRVFAVPGTRGTQRVPPCTDTHPQSETAESSDSARTGPLLDADLKRTDQLSAEYLHFTHSTCFLATSEKFCRMVINVTNEKSENLLHEAVKKPDCKSTVEHLLRLGVDLEKKSSSGMTPLHQAVRTSSPEVVEGLLKASANMEAKSREGWTALHHAIDVRSMEKVELLIRYHADVNARASYDVTPLHQACMHLHLDIVDALLKVGACANHRDFLKRTPLHYAVLAGDLDIVQCLLYCEARTDLRDMYGNTAVDCAKERGYEDLARVMQFWAEGK